MAVAVALIAAIASLIVSSVIAIRVERIRKSITLEDEDVRKTLDFLGRTVELLQEYRDELAMIGHAPEGTLSVESAVEMLGETRAAFAGAYRSGVAVVPRSCARLAHDVKNMLNDVTDALVTELRMHGFSGELTRRVERERQNLRDYQVLLTDARLEIRVHGISGSGAA
jgi:hypothetical protein